MRSQVQFPTKAKTVALFIVTVKLVLNDAD